MSDERPRTVMPALLLKNAPRRLGEGSYGVVYSAVDVIEYLMENGIQYETTVYYDNCPTGNNSCKLDLNTSKCMALKFFQGPDTTERQSNAMLEINSMMKVFAALPDSLRALSILSNPLGIIEVTYKGVKEVGVFMKYKKYDAVDNLYKKLQNPNTTLEDLIIDVFDMSTAFILFCGALHNAKIVHHDAKVENMIAYDVDHCVDPENRFRHSVADYGMVDSVDKVTLAGTPLFMSPMLVPLARDEVRSLWEQVGLRDEFDSYYTRAYEFEKQNIRNKSKYAESLNLVGEIDYHSMGASIVHMYNTFKKDYSLNQTLLKEFKKYLYDAARLMMYPFDSDIFKQINVSGGIPLSTPSLIRLTKISAI